ncbi:MAG: CHAD domain-containing protein [Bacteroidetes bacterium]|nr:CHAD domain-containing protein [Bacteroidota bacterium]
MKKKEVENIIKTIFDSLKKLLRQVDRGYKKKDIHNFRIEIKKLKALLAFANSGEEKQAWIKIPGQLQSIYSTSGKIRELQILEEKLKKAGTGNNDAFKRSMHQLKINKKAYKKKLHTRIKKFNPRDGEKKLISEFHASNSSLNTGRFFNEKNKLIYSILTARHASEQDLHSARKNIKDLMYVMEFLNQYNELPSGTKILLQTPADELENIAGQLGILNDLRISISELKTTHLNNISRKDAKKLQSLKKKWKVEKKVILKHLRDTLKIISVESHKIS